jgi:Permuted papain-like amidase enzyme, YaeF/YiiX, C92 family
MNWGKNLLRLVIALVVLYLLLSIPLAGTHQTSGAGKKSFAWNQDEAWKALEAKFQQTRSSGCPAADSESSKRLLEGNSQLVAMATRQYGPTDPFFDRVEENLFQLGPLMAACPERISEYAGLTTSLRAAVKMQSRQWDVREKAVRDRLYRLLYGGRTALEEVMLQTKEDAVPAVVIGTGEPSQTPAFQHAGITFHSGDVLVSRGGAPTSALIARGNDYPGNFSHIALLYVDEATRTPYVIEAHIERGVVISSLDEYLKDKKLRLMALRVRADHPLLRKDPLLPHRAAKMAYDEVKARHIPYDFAMDFNESLEKFCSEVASHVYSSQGLTLWNIVTTMSSQGLVNWLADFGVRNFVTQAPADLEYDPQLVVVAEWRDRTALWQAHVDDAITDAILEAAERGERLGYDWYLLAPARLAKAYSMVLNRFGKEGPVPEGMDAGTALKSMSLDKLHKGIKQKLLSKADAFEKSKGYRPPFWELVKLAREAEGGGKK